MPQDGQKEKERKVSRVCWGSRGLKPLRCELLWITCVAKVPTCSGKAAALQVKRKSWSLTGLWSRSETPFASSRAIGKSLNLSEPRLCLDATALLQDVGGEG